MDASVPKKSSIKNSNVSFEEAKKAVETLIKWAGDNPKREGLIDTPKRVVKAYQEFFSGYKIDPKEILSKTFDEVGGYDDLVLLKDIDLNSHCEHHMVPIIGKVHIAYMPDKNVVGISKIARVVDVFAKLYYVFHCSSFNDQTLKMLFTDRASESFVNNLRQTYINDCLGSFLLIMPNTSNDF